MNNKGKKIIPKSAFARHVVFRPKPHEGYRSKFEYQIAKALDMTGKTYKYEEETIKYNVPESNHKYTPDFKIDGTEFFLEVKGIFDKEDRKKHLLIKEQQPDIDIRFVFYNAKGKIYKGSKTTYSDWCDKHGFRWSHRVIPKAWLQEKKNAGI